MFNANDAQCLTILQSAVSAEFGLVIRCADPLKTRASFYKVRKNFGDPTMSDLTIRVSPDDPAHEIWLFHLRRANAPTLSLGAAPDA